MRERGKKGFLVLPGLFGFVAGSFSLTSNWGKAAESCRVYVTKQRRRGLTIRLSDSFSSFLSLSKCSKESLQYSCAPCNSSTLTSSSCEAATQQEHELQVTHNSNHSSCSSPVLPADPASSCFPSVKRAAAAESASQESQARDVWGRN